MACINMWLTNTNRHKTPNNVKIGHLRATVKHNLNFTSDSYEHEYFRIIINIYDFGFGNTQVSRTYFVAIEECCATKCTRIRSLKLTITPLGAIKVRMNWK